ncbi:hypothetical protein [Flavobacterium algicola]|uniref:hypothetical protein n=1 Tax=Flavobacterium algicola TaxID=556529 RepID=UPI001EFC8586|nr:hypothetical protein [Flavobacterium algicola]MCG9791554.1 hypothetical protein [Flavobacterium algicola]
MKKSLSFILLLICICTSAQKKSNSDYGSYLVDDLKKQKVTLELDANYFLVNNYLNKIEREETTHLPLTKIDATLTNTYWKNSPVLKEAHDKWKEAAANVSAFEKKNAPELPELGSQLRNKKITESEYFKKNREIRGQLLKEYPQLYPQLSEKHISSLKSMWKLTGRYMLEDHKNKSMLFPTYWIPEKDLEIEEKDKKYKAIKKELIEVQKELNLKTAK